MSTEDNNQEGSAASSATGEGQVQTAAEIKLAKAEYDELVGYKTTVGSLKRELKDLRKAQEERETPKDTPKNQTEEFGLLQKTFLRSAGLADDEEINLAKDIQKKTGLEWDKLIEDDYFQSKLQKHRDGKANALATNVDGARGPSGGSSNTPEHWIAKGTPPTPKDVPDRKTRAKIVRAMLDNEKNGGGKFYNEG